MKKKIIFALILVIIFGAIIVFFWNRAAVRPEDARIAGGISLAETSSIQSSAMVECKTFYVASPLDLSLATTISFQVVENFTGYEIWDYTIKINDGCAQGKVNALAFIASLPEGRYDYIISAPEHDVMSSNFDTSFLKQGSDGDNPRVQVNMGGTKSRNMEKFVSDQDYSARDSGEGIIFGHIATSKYQPFSNVAIYSDHLGQSTKTDQNGFFMFRFLQKEVKDNCPVLFIRQSGYKQVHIHHYSGAILQIRLQEGSGLINMNDERQCPANVVE